MTLGTAELSLVAEKCTHGLSRTAYEALIRQGEIGDNFYLLRRGAGQCACGRARGEDKVATLEAGSYFGERALIYWKTAAMRLSWSQGTGMAYALAKDEFNAALAATPSLQEQLQKVYFGR